MRHYKKGRKLGTSASHTKAIKKNLVVALFTNDRIKTTLERAKEIRGDVDRVITWAKRGDVHSRRLAIAAIGDKNLVAEIFTKVEQGLFKDRPGGYSRILRLGNRRGDAAPIVIMELVQEPVVKKDAVVEPAKKSVISRVARKSKSAKAVEEVVEVDESTNVEAAAEAEEPVEETVVDVAADVEESAEEIVVEETEETDK
ncbi:MAG: 50S ribosomal protein L17 [Coriobacteriaceae bacterium]|nr:50S ribosomal protein L17 [Coriobacteriaceae bacterium]